MKRLSPALALLPLVLTGSAYAQGTITGQIIDAVTGKPLPGLTVSVEDEWSQELDPPVRVETDKEGRYLLSSLELGAYRLKTEFQQEVEGRTLVFALPTRVFDLGGDPIQVDFSYTPLDETSPAYQYVVEQAGEGVHPGEVVRLGEAWLSSSRAYNAAGEVVSIKGGYFEVR